MKGDIGLREPRRNEVRRRGIPRRPLDMRRVEQSDLRKFRVELETDEPTLQAAVEAEREGGRDVGIQGGPVVAVEQVQETARVVGEAPAVRKVADVADARPPGSVLIGRVQPACIRQARDLPDLDAQSTFDYRLRNRIADLRVHRAGGPESQDYQDDERYR